MGTSKYKVLKGTIGRMEDDQNKIYRKNDFIYLESDEAKAYGDSLQLSPESTSEDADTDWSFIADKTAPEVIDLINSTEDRSEVEAIAEAERGGRQRKGVLDAAQKRLEALE